MMNESMINAASSVLLIVAGFFAARTQLMKSTVFEQLPELLFSLCYPSLIISTISGANFFGMLSQNSFTVVFAAAATVFMLAVGIAVAKKIGTNTQKELVILSLMLSNTGFVGLPVIALLCGARGVYFSILYGSVQDLFMWTYGYQLFAKQKLASPMKLLKSPCIIAIFIGFIISISGIAPIPIAGTAIDSLAAMTVPVVLLYIGYILAKEGSAIFKISRQVFLCSGIKVWLFPLIAFAACLMLPIDNELKAICTVVVGTPTPVISVIFAKQFGKDANFATMLLIISTLLYILTFAVVLPLFIHF